MSELHPDFPALAHFRTRSDMTLLSTTDHVFQQASTPRAAEGLPA